MNKLQQKTILVIEDERPLLRVIQEKLEKEGIRVLASRNVERAFSTDLEKDIKGEISISSIERALKHLDELGMVDAVWLDHNLLGSENGVDFVTRLKANGGHWSHIPIFVVSNASDEALVRSYHALGVDRYYVKAEHKLEDIISDIQESFVHTPATQ